MSKVAIIGDLHLGTRGGDEVFMLFQIEYLRKFIADAKGYGISMIIQAGDFFDVRRSMSILLMHHVIHTIIPMFRAAGMRVFVIDGNHDIFYRDDNSIDSNELLEALAPDVFTIIRESREIDIYGEKFLFLGWINKNNMEKQVQVAALSNAKYCIGHLALTGFAMYKGVKSEEGMSLEPFKGFQKVYTGHYHTVSDHQNVQYIGAPYHLNWADYPDGENRGWWLLDVKTGKHALMNNEPDQSLFGVFDYDPDEDYPEGSLDQYAGKLVKIVVESKPNERKYKKFLSVVTQTKFIDYKIIDNAIVDKKENTVVISEKELATDTPSVMSTYLERLATEGIIDDVEGVKTLAMDIFTRATNAK